MSKKVKATIIEAVEVTAAFLWMLAFVITYNKTDNLTASLCVFFAGAFVALIAAFAGSRKEKK